MMSADELAALRAETAEALRRLRTYLDVLPEGTHALGEIAYDSRLRSELWPRNAYAPQRSDLEAVLGEVARLAACLQDAEAKLYRVRDEVAGHFDPRSFRLQGILDCPWPDEGSALAEAVTERDRYRAAWQSARFRATAYGEGILRHYDERDSYEGWMNEQAARAAGAERERDSYGREADRLRRDWTTMRDRAEQAERERDELRAEVERLRAECDRRAALGYTPPTTSETKEAEK